MGRIGRDYLGAAYYRKVVLKTHPHGQGGGVFWEEFNHGKNTGKACVIEWAKKGPGFMPFIRIQGLWDGSHGYRNKKKKALKIAAQVNQIALQFPNIDFYYSPYCEADSVDQSLLNELKARYPKLIIVHTANKGAPLAKNGILNETHGDFQPSQMDCFSYDGLSCINADSETFKEMIPRLVYFMYWTASDNGRRNDSEKAPHHSKRLHWTSKKMNISITYQSTNTRAAADLPPKFLGKSHGDPDTKPNPRDDNKYVMLCPIKAKRVEFLMNGKVVHRLKYSGQSHEDGRHIYRSKKWGYELAKKGRVLRVQIDGRFYGQVDPGFRVNEYRNRH